LTLPVILVLDREFSSGTLLERLVSDGLTVVLRLNLGSRPPVILDGAGERLRWSLAPGQKVCDRAGRYRARAQGRP